MPGRSCIEVAAPSSVPCSLARTDSWPPVIVVYSRTIGVNLLQSRLARSQVVSSGVPRHLDLMLYDSERPSGSMQHTGKSYPAS